MVSIFYQCLDMNDLRALLEPVKYDMQLIDKDSVALTLPNPHYFI